MPAPAAGTARIKTVGLACREQTPVLGARLRGAGRLWLSGYYKMGELMDSSLEQRKHDLAYWRSQERTSRT